LFFILTVHVKWEIVILFFESSRSFTTISPVASLVTYFLVTTDRKILSLSVPGTRGSSKSSVIAAELF